MNRAHWPAAGPTRGHWPGLCCCLIWLLLSSCSAEQTTVTFFHASSLDLLIDELARRFEKNHPQVRIVAEGSGSLAALSKITESSRSCDLLATSDPQLIIGGLGQQGFRQLHVFAGNEMVLASARPEFLEPAESWQENWFELLFSRGHSYGIGDPERDPAGYYAHLVWKLAELFYQRQGLYRRFTSRLDPSWVQLTPAALLSSLQAGRLDFAFIYKSMAFQHGLEFVPLPAQIGLSEATYAPFYQQVFVRINDPRSGVTVDVDGKPIRYGVALLDESNPWAVGFLNFLLSPESQELYRELGYTQIPVRQLQRSGISASPDRSSRPQP